jgi:hypothetical protein
MAGILVTVATVAAASLCAIAPAASAKSKVITASGTAAITGQGVNGSALAKCPKGTRAIAGGYSQSPPASLVGTSMIDVSDSYRQSARTWIVSGTQVAGGSGQLTAHAYCARGIGKVKAAVLPLPLAAAPRSEVTATAECPGKTKSISGGYRKPPFSSGSFVFLSDNERANPHSWTVTAVRGSVGAVSAGTVYSVAYCVKAVKVDTAFANAPVLVSTAPSVPATVSAPRCPKKATFSGGFRSPYVQGGADRGAFLVTDALVSAKVWSVSGLAFGGPGAAGLPINVGVLGYCR